MSNTNQKGIYSICRLNAGNLNDLAILHTAVYGKVPLPGYFERKYNTAYTNVEYIGFIAYNTLMLPIAFYGVIPCFMLCKGKPVLSAQSADTMTHPDHRNKGLFVELANRTFELCIQVGIKLLFGFPNQNSLPGFINKLGWQTVGWMDCFVIPVKTLPAAKLAAKFPWLKKLYSYYTHWMLKKYTIPPLGIFSSALTSGYDGVLRNDGYLQNKTYSTTQVISINGANIWIKINSGLLIGDLSVNTQNFTSVIDKLINIARNLGLNQVQFHTSRDTPLHQLFARQYKAIDSFPVIFKDLGSGVSTDKIKFTFADIDIF
jgi:GNAT superfamily N-acetyltransferase